MKNILFLCTGNSCRSLIAEAITNELGNGSIISESAGSCPTGFAHPKAIAVLEQHGIETNGLDSKPWDNFANRTFDYVITVCDSASCEALSRSYECIRKTCIGVFLTLKFEGTEDEQMKIFNKTFFMLKEKIVNNLLLLSLVAFMS